MLGGVTMTEGILFQKLEKIRSSNIAGAEQLIVDLNQSANECFGYTIDNSPVEYIRLRGKYPKSMIKIVFSKLGVKVTHVSRKPGKCEWKTIVHFTDVSNSPQ